MSKVDKIMLTILTIWWVITGLVYLAAMVAKAPEGDIQSAFRAFAFISFTLILIRLHLLNKTGGINNHG